MAEPEMKKPNPRTVAVRLRLAIEDLLRQLATVTAERDTLKKRVSAQKGVITRYRKGTLGQ